MSAPFSYTGASSQILNHVAPVPAAELSAAGDAGLMYAEKYCVAIELLALSSRFTERWGHSRLGGRKVRSCVHNPRISIAAYHSILEICLTARSDRAGISTCASIYDPTVQRTYL